MYSYYVPARKSIAESSNYEIFAGTEVTAVTRTILDNGFPYFPKMFFHSDTVLNIFGSAVDKIIEGVWEAQEAMNWAQNQAQGIMTSINEKKEIIQLNSLILHQNYPNPFNPIIFIH